MHFRGISVLEYNIYWGKYERFTDSIGYYLTSKFISHYKKT